MKQVPGRILVPVDFMAPSVAALEASYVLAERFRADVHVLHATTMPSFVEPGLAVRLVSGQSTTTIEALALEEAAKNLDRLVRDTPAPAGVTVTRDVQFGLPLEVVATQAKRFDLLVVGTHGRTGLDHMFVGSVAERIVRHVDRPIFVARDQVDVRRILVPVDFSNASQAAFSYGRMVAQQFGAELKLLHVVPSIPALESAELLVVSSGTTPMMALHDYARWRAEEDLMQFMSACGEVQPADVEVRMGDPGEQIVESARAHDSDLIVMGTHGCTEWAWVGVGSVAERVIRQAPCSVLTTRWHAPQLKSAEASTTGAKRLAAGV